MAAEGDPSAADFFAVKNSENTAEMGSERGWLHRSGTCAWSATGQAVARIWAAIGVDWDSVWSEAAQVARGCDKVGFQGSLNK